MKSNYARVESIQNLSGRIYLWKIAVPKALEKPFGYGFCLGGTALDDKVTLFKSKATISMLGESPSKHALHSGYIQALCDLGLIGFFIYSSIFLIGLIAAIKHAMQRRHKVYVHLFVTLAIMNITESVIMSPRSVNVLLFWMAWFVLIIPERKSFLKAR